MIRLAKRTGVISRLCRSSVCTTSAIHGIQLVVVVDGEDGVWQGEDPLDFALSLLAVQIVVILTVTQGLALALRPLRQPKVVVEILVDPPVGASAHLVNPHNGNDNYNKFVSCFIPILPLKNAFLTDIQQEAFGFDGIMNPLDPMDAFLNQTLVDPDEHSSTTTKIQYDSNIPTEFENHWNMQVEPQDGQCWIATS